MCNPINACQTAIFGWLKQRSLEKKKRKASLSSWAIFDSSTEQYGQVESQSSKVYIFKRPSVHPSPLFILCGPRWLECLHSSEWERRKVSFLCTVYFSKNILPAFPLEGCSRPIRGPPSAAVLWTGWWEMFRLFSLHEFKNVWLIRSFCCRSCPANWKCHKDSRGSRTVGFLKVQIMCEYAENLIESKNKWQVATTN